VSLLAVTGTQHHRISGGRQQLLGGGEQSEQLSVVGKGEHRRPTMRPRGDQSAVAQARQVRRDRGLGQAEMSGQVHHSVLTQHQVTQDRQSTGIAEAAEQARRRRQGASLVDLGPRSRAGCFHRHVAMLALEGERGQAFEINYRDAVEEEVIP
jgi:hypothetical protein